MERKVFDPEGTVAERIHHKRLTKELTTKLPTWQGSIAMERRLSVRGGSFDTLVIEIPNVGACFDRITSISATDGAGHELKDGDLVSGQIFGKRRFGIFNLKKTLAACFGQIYARWEAETPGTWDTDICYLPQEKVRFETRLPTLC